MYSYIASANFPGANNGQIYDIYFSIPSQYRIVGLGYACTGNEGQSVLAYYLNNNKVQLHCYNGSGANLPAQANASVATVLVRKA